MQKTSLKHVSVFLVLAMCLSLFSFSIHAEADGGASALRPMEYLTRGLVAAKVQNGVFLSWRFLGNEPDGLSWNIYRKDGDADFVKIATITPRDVQPESSYETNPGIVKENVTPSNYVDPDGQVNSIYEVAPVINGIEGVRQGMSVPMLSATHTSGSNAYKGAVHFIPLKPAPERVPLAHFMYRGYRFGPGTNLNSNNMVIPGTGGQHWYVVDMDLLREFRTAYEEQTTVTQEQLNAWVDKLNQYNTTPNNMGIATYTEPRPLVNSLVDGKITEALYKELEGEFIKYVENLDCGTRLPYAKTEAGAIHTSLSGNYSTQDMTVGDFDGDGEYEIVVKWRSTQVDPMYSEPIYSGSNTTTAPEYIDVYKQDGTMLFRVDMGYNIRAANDHETNLFCHDFDGDGKTELMLKTGLGTRIGNWSDEENKVVFEDTVETVVGGVDGLNATTDKFKEYFATGNEQALDTYWALLNSFTISYRSPVAGGGNDGVNDPNQKRWIKTYHVGPIGPAKDDQEFFTAFEWDEFEGKGVIVDSALYPHPYRGSVDGENWAVTPCSQRGNYSYLAFPGPGVGSGPSNYKAQIMAEKEAYWLVNPWKPAVWGDAQGNRANRYLGVVAALDGENYYAVSQRGYYHRTTFAAFNIVNGKINLQACFDSADPQYWSLGGTWYDYQNRGNHHTNSADLDGDGWDEIVMKAMVLGLSADKTKILPKVINGDIMPTIEGQQGVVPTTDFEFATEAIRNNPLNVWAPLRHGDRGSLLPVDKDNNIRMWSGNEEHLFDDIRNGVHYGWLPGPGAHDPMKGRRLNEQGEVIYENSLIYGVYSGRDAEGNIAGNFSNRWPGAQGHSQNGARSMITGERLSGGNNISTGAAIWFGSGLTHMGASGGTISTINDLTFQASNYLSTGYTSTGNKGTPTLKADIFGDWREEIILRSGNNLAIVTTLAPTEYGIRTLMHDPMYRLGVANKNQGYDQCGYASFYLGDEAPLPKMRTDIAVPAITQDAKVVLVCDKTTVEPGSSFTVGVKLEGAINDIYAEDITIEYDKSLFEFVEAEPVSSEILTVELKSEDVLRIIAVNKGGITGNAPIYKLKFHAKNVETDSPSAITVTRAELGSPFPLPNGTVVDAVGGSVSVAIRSSYIPVTGVSIDQGDMLNIVEGDTVLLTATITPANASDKRLSWSSDNEAVATVDAATGLVTAKAEGTAVITVSAADGATDKITIIVVKEGLPGDINDDGKVDVGDLAIAAYYYNAKPGDDNWDEAKIADVNGDNIVDILDLAMIAQNIL